MRYIIASDIHGSAFWCERLLKAFKSSNADRMILLGDVLYHGPRNGLPKDYDPKRVIAMLNEMADVILAVRGNCDAQVDEMMLDFPILSDSAFICDLDKRLFCTHGHLLNPEHLPPLCDGDIFLFGHTHIPMDEIVMQKEKKIRCINPGSVSIPKNGSANRCLAWDDDGFSEIIL
ncbi:MAG: phosphodiesterase [Ruminococcus sp.]|nr:phosphodiesterase [Ruminococcus sp.]